MRKKTIDQRLQELQDDVKKILAIIDPDGKTPSSDSDEDNQEAMMTIKAVADFLRMEVSAIVGKCENGEMPYTKQGKSIKIKRADLIGWIRKRKDSDEGSVENYVNRYLDKHPLKG